MLPLFKHLSSDISVRVCFAAERMCAVYVLTLTVFPDAVVNHSLVKRCRCDRKQQVHLTAVSLRQSDCFLRLVSQVTRGMFGANRKKFMEGGVESDYADDSSLYYTQQSMFPPHRADKDVSGSQSSSSGLLVSFLSL